MDDTNTLPGFGIHRGTGFHITYENGCTASVQFGEGNYCDNRYDGKTGAGCATAEVAAWDADNNWITNLDGDETGTNEGGRTVSIIGWLKPAEVLRFLNAVAAYTPE